MSEVHFYDALSREIDEDDIHKQYYIMIKFTGDLCLPYPLKSLRSLKLDCGEEDRLFIDAPHVITIYGKRSNLANVSYLPSLMDCSPIVMRTIYPLLSSEMQEKMDEEQRIYDHFKLKILEEELCNKGEDLWTMVKDNFVRSCMPYYHGLHEQGVLLPPRRITAKSARSISQ